MTKKPDVIKFWQGPIRCVICKETDRDRDLYIKEALRSNDVYLDKAKGEYFVKIGGDAVWKARDAVFRNIPSGLYRFDSDGNARLVS